MNNFWEENGCYSEFNYIKLINRITPEPRNLNLDKARVVFHTKEIYAIMMPVKAVHTTLNINVTNA